jgi:hypothetical protein
MKSFSGEQNTEDRNLRARKGLVSVFCSRRGDAVDCSNDKVENISLGRAQSQPQNISASPCLEQNLFLLQLLGRRRLNMPWGKMTSSTILQYHSCTMSRGQSKHIRHDMTWKEN